MTSAGATPSIGELIASAPWRSLEAHLDEIRPRVDRSIARARVLREQYRDELLSDNPGLVKQILRPSKASLAWAKELLKQGTVAAADGTLSPVPLLGGSKIQVGVVIVSNTGEIVDLVTRVFEAELSSASTSAREFFSNLRRARGVSNLLARAIMLFGERSLLSEHRCDWRMIHGELVPHELRTGAGRPGANLPATFDLVERYVDSSSFIAVTEGSGDLDVLNAAILLEPGEYIVLRPLTVGLNLFLDGDDETGQSRANFNERDRHRFREFIAHVGSRVSVVLVKAGPTPFLLECPATAVEEAVSLFLVDSLWTRGFPAEGSGSTTRGFPFHLDLADQVARTLFKGADFRRFVETRLYDLGVEAAVAEIDPRRTRG